MIKEKLGRRIFELRKRLNISQEELAEKLGISQKSLSKIETGRNFLTSETLEKLLAALDVKITELFDYEHTDEKASLIEQIYNYIDSIKNDEKSLIILYKIVQAMGKK